MSDIQDDWWDFLEGLKIADSIGPHFIYSL